MRMIQKLASLAIGVAALIVACGHNISSHLGIIDQPAEASEAIHNKVLIIADNSGSEDAARLKTWSWTLPAARKWIGRYSIDVCLFDASVRDIATISPRSMKEYTSFVGDAVLKSPGATGTDFEPVAKRVEAEAALAAVGHYKLDVLVLTNAGFDSLANFPSEAASLRRLAGLHSLALGPVTEQAAPVPDHNSYYGFVKSCLEDGSGRFIVFPDQEDTLRQTALAYAKGF